MSYKYHYTSIESLHAIIQYESLRMTHYKYLNDPTELAHSYETFREALVKEGLEDKRGILDYFYEEYNYYVFCLSDVRDSLNQYRLYGNDGAGVCIKFNTEKLTQSLHQDRNRHHCLDCSYDDSFIKPSVQLFKKYLEENPEGTAAVMVDDVIRVISNLLSCKHEAYSVEEEFRYIIQFTHNSTRTHKPNIKLGFSTIDSLIKPFITVPIKPLEIIDEVILGPRCDKRNVKSLKMLRIKNVAISDLPYR